MLIRAVPDPTLRKRPAFSTRCELFQVRHHPACFSNTASARLSIVEAEEWKRTSAVDVSRTVPSLTRAPTAYRVVPPDIVSVAPALLPNVPDRSPPLHTV